MHPCSTTIHSWECTIRQDFFRTRWSTKMFSHTCKWNWNKYKPLHSCTLSTFRVPMVKLTQFHTGFFSYQVEDRHIPFSQLCVLKHVKLWKCSLTGMGKDTRHFATSCQCSGCLTDSWLLLISLVSANWVKLAWTTATQREREKERHWKRSRGNDREGWEHMQDSFRTLLLL